MREDHCLDHLADGERLTAMAGGVLGLKPVEAEIAVVGPLLFGEQKGKSFLIGHVRPARTVIIAGRTLGTAVEDNNQGRRVRQKVGKVDFGREGAGIGAEAGEVRQPIREYRMLWLEPAVSHAML